MIQLLSIAIFVLYLIVHPSKHDQFKHRLLWFIGAVVSLIGISTAQRLSMTGNVVVLLMGALPLLLAFPYDFARRR